MRCPKVKSRFVTIISILYRLGKRRYHLRIRVEKGANARIVFLIHFAKKNES